VPEGISALERGTACSALASFAIQPRYLLAMSSNPVDADPPLSRLGLGAWAFGRTGWGSQDDRDSRSAILRAVEQGVNWIDTAAVYGDGHSERMLGAALSELREPERPLIFTKGGLRIDPSSGRTVRDLSAASLRRECEASLQRLGVDRIDLYQLHWPVSDAGTVEEAWKTLGDLQDEGKIRWAGVSNFDVPLLDRCAARRTIDAAQVPLSLLSRDSAGRLLPWGLEHRLFTMAYSPLESGLLSGGFSMRRLRSLPEGDWRQKRDQFQRPQFERTLALVNRIEPIASELGASVAETAIAWTLAWPGVGGVIVGARNAAQVDGWIGAGRLALNDDVLGEIEDALLETGAGEGPSHPPPERPVTVE
jgi:aryl-alcohol dehydrogenase-like predicted oxidoreductase